MNGGGDPTFCHCHDPVPLENCLTCLTADLRAVTRARNALAMLALTLADGDMPPSATGVHGLIAQLRKVGSR